MRLQSLQPSELTEDLREQILQIFFADKEFTDIESKSAFQKRWMTPYFSSRDELCHFYFATDEKNQVLSYLVCGLNSQHFLEQFSQTIKSYALFADLFSDYPAHLHINNRPEARGLGVGSQLIQFFLQDLRDREIKGVHLVTTADAKNVGFYEKNGFQDKVERSFRPGIRLLFMGQLL